MRDVDLHRARLRFVEFCKLDMTSVQWPTDDDHVVVGNYPGVLDRLISTVEQSLSVSVGRSNAVLDPLHR
jgi:hypothetical protein